METLEQLWPILSAGLVVPLVQWIKSKILIDAPAFTVTLSLGLNFLIVYLLDLWLVTGLTGEGLFNMVLIGNTAAQVIHAGYKTRVKNS